MLLILLLFLTLLLQQAGQSGAAATWCIAKSGASQNATQLALDYACGPGMADCTPIQSSGLCYLPNTLQAHASYAFNSFYQRSNGAPGACEFGGAAVVTVTDPSYGSCTYPSSASSGGGGSTGTPGIQTPTSPSTGTPGITPTFTPMSPFGGTGTGFGGLSPPNYSSSLPVKSASLFVSFVLASCISFL